MATTRALAPAAGEPLAMCGVARARAHALEVRERRHGELGEDPGYLLTITGISGSLTHTTSVTLKLR